MAYLPPQGGPPTSFKTNVNRAKTKRWVEAKSYSYDGDDWGDMDEYDEYSGYDEPAPPPRPTGLRQQGQSASRDQHGASPIQPAGYGSAGFGHPEASQHGYGNLSRQPPPNQQYGVRSTTNPPYHQSQLRRSGSFDRGDERRAFSAAAPHQGPPPSGMYQGAPNVQSQGPTTQHQYFGEPPPRPSNYSDMQDRNFHRDQNYPPPANNPPLQYSDQTRRTEMSSRTLSMNSDTSATDFHNRRDFSPSALPPPLHTRDSPSPQRLSESQSAFRPPRKSSLGQQNHSDQQIPNQEPMQTADLDDRGAHLAARERAESDTSKPLPFVRPADIYRRMQEEKERERQSQDSSRPSMEAITADGRSRNDPRSSSSGATERSQEAEHSDVLRSSLEPVAERKSEYGMSGVSIDKMEPKDVAEVEPSNAAHSRQGTELSGTNSSLSPQLPDLARMSGFGELFASTSRQLEGLPATSAPQQDDTPHFTTDQPLQGQFESLLQHQPSLGLRSVVHQAFDTTHEPIPETPSSSVADSSIGRSGSGGTSAVSPIISRGPSSATTNLNFRDPQIRPATPPTSGGNAGSLDRPLSSDTLSTPKADAREPSPDPADQPPARFMPGHRRDLSTPSPDNSPARTPALEAKKQLQQPQEAELATTTPVETRFPRTHGQPVSPLSSWPSPTKLPGAAESISPFKSPVDELPKSPADSTRSRVRNLADKFESGRSSPAGSERAPSPVKPNFASSLVTNQPRPLPADRLESFRPRLPGGWESSASLAPATISNRNEAIASSIPFEQRLQNTAADRSNLRTESPLTTSVPIKSQQPRASSPIQAEEAMPASDPFASLAAAGSALAGAFSTAIGSEKDDSKRDVSEESPVKTAEQPNLAMEDEFHDGTASHKAFTNTGYTPEASKPTLLATPDDGISSIMPTPLDKMSRPGLSGESKAVDYFATGTKQHQQTSVDSYTTQDSASTKRSQLLPSLSTDTGPQYESDRLRREIIRELSPRVTSEPSTAESNSPMRDESRNPKHVRQQHESLIIPREYDSYWNGSGSEQSSRASSLRDSSQAGYNHNQSVVSPAHEVEKPPHVSEEERPQSQDNLLERPDMPPQRFSWETPSENHTPKPQPLQSPQQPSSGDVRARGDGLDESEGPLFLHRGLQSQQRVDVPDPGLIPIGVGAPSAASDERRSMEARAENHTSEAKRSMDSARAHLRTASERPACQDQPRPSMDEMSPSSTRSQPHQHQRVGPSGDTDDSSKSQIAAPDLLIPSAPPSVIPKIQSFREILALKEARDRIRGYNETREQFANMETGLGHWLAVITSEFPEHNDLLPNGKITGQVGAKPLASRTKLGGLLPSGSSTQQPYYQQYLNASSPSGASDGAQVPAGNPTLGYSPSSGGGGGKLSSQQMQARGKDLLHTAGLFGGKANVAAKGLLSKGKSRFRGGNADKAPTSSSNINQDRGSPKYRQSSQRFPSTPKSGVFLEQSHSSPQSNPSRPRSYIAPSAHSIGREMSQDDQRPSEQQPLERQPSSLASAAGERNHTVPSAEISTLQHQRPDLGLLGDHATNILSTDINQANMAEVQDLTEDRSDKEHQNSGQIEDLHGSDVTPSNNRTPTQADYADYFRRGSSPTAIKLQTDVIEVNQQTSLEEPLVQQPKEERGIYRDDLPTLQSRYSTKTPRAVSFVVANTTNPNQNQPSMDRENLQRASEDSDGTFYTAGSVSGADLTKTVVGAHQNLPSAIPEQSSESPTTRVSSGGSSSATAPFAAPAANIQDQPKARPFSFIQFSQNPGPKPLEDHFRRRPSIESLPSRIDPEQDVPPSPISPQHSIIHEQKDDTSRTSPVQHGIGHDFGPSTTRPMSSSPSRSFSRPFQDTHVQDHPVLRRDQSPTRQVDLPSQHYPAPISRQDSIHPRQQATEYSLEGVGPPPASQPRPRPTESGSSSKRGSRSSAFFRAFRSPTDPVSPPLAGDREELDYIHQSDDPTFRRSKSKRSSLFRSLTGGTKSSRNEEVAQSQQDFMQPSQARPNEDILQGQRQLIQPAHTQEYTPPSADNAEKTHAPTKTPSKYRNRLSRTATPKEREQAPPEPGKKKRFSSIGSLFGRSKDHRGSNKAQIDRPQQGTEEVILENSQQPPESKRRFSSLTKPGRGSALPSESRSGRDTPYQHTRDSLAREGLLPQKPRKSSSRSPEPSAYTETSAKQQQMFPPRHQSLGQGAQRQDPRPSEGPRQFSTSSDLQPQTMQASNPRHQFQTKVTTWSSTRPSGGLLQPDPKPRQLSSFTTTTTTSSRGGGKTVTTHRQNSLGNNFTRSNSPPPPPPPPKDSWHQGRSHHRSKSSISAVSNSIDPPAPTSDKQQSHLSTLLPKVISPSPSQTANYNYQYTNNPVHATSTASPPPPHTQQSRTPSVPNHQSLPPLQTNISNSSSPAGPRPYTNNTAAEARKNRRSQIESSDTLGAEFATITNGTGLPDPEARKLRRSEFEGMGTHKANSAGTTTGSATSDPEARKARRSQIESSGTARVEQPNPAGASEVAGNEKDVDISLGRKSEDEPIVMTATSFPGQEWQPNYGGWDEY
ncbi:MAG: hypothetical protein Q9209_002644 [Squamulea sp. 1 TL-2023]